MEIKMGLRGLTWLVLRMFVLVMSIFGPLFRPDTSAMPSWIVFVIVPVFFAVALFFWLQLAARRNADILIRPASWTLPFYPMQKNPMRFWLLGACVFIIVGISTTISSIYRFHSLRGESLLLFIGVAVLLSLTVSIKSLGKRKLGNVTLPEQPRKSAH